MDVQKLRAKHAIFRYQGFNLAQAPYELVITFDFLLEPDIRFQPEIRIPLEKPIDETTALPLVFNLGMVEAISYWKAACPAKFIVEAGHLSGEQAAWWHDLFLQGLGEFFYQNQIEFTGSNLLTITSTRVTSVGGPPRRGPLVGILGGKRSAGPAPAGDLILVGGGKDSAVTLELTRGITQRRGVLLLNPTPAMTAVSEIAGFTHPLIVKRTIDPALLVLNRAGYLNGHTPFSAYLAFLGLLVASLYGFRHVIASNESSASEGNVEYLGRTVNHQYSKGYRFEKKFRAYSHAVFKRAPEYFSFLRPITELQTAYLFSQMPQYFSIFKSCNVGRGVRWCGKCAKCCFVYLVLSPFVKTDTLVSLFGSDLFNEKTLEGTFLALVGLGGHKPFECVGTKEESVQAISLTIARYEKEGRVLPKTLVVLKEKLGIRVPVDTEAILRELTSHWDKEHFLPKKYEEALKEALRG